MNWGAACMMCTAAISLLPCRTNCTVPACGQKKNQNFTISSFPVCLTPEISLVWTTLHPIVSATRFIQSRHGYSGEFPILKKLMDELLSISTTPSPFCRARTVSLLTELFYHLSRLLQTENTGTDTIPEDIRTIIDYMGAHLAESCRSEFLAGLIHLSPPQFQRKFRRSTGLFTL